MKISTLLDHIDSGQTAIATVISDMDAELTGFKTAATKPTHSSR